MQQMSAHTCSGRLEMHVTAPCFTRWPIRLITGHVRWSWSVTLCLQKPHCRAVPAAVNLPLLTRGCSWLPRILHHRQLTILALVSNLAFLAGPAFLSGRVNREGPDFFSAWVSLVDSSMNSSILANCWNTNRWD